MCFKMSFTKVINVILLSEQLWILDFLNKTVSFWISALVEILGHCYSILMFISFASINLTALTVKRISFFSYFSILGVFYNKFLDLDYFANCALLNTGWNTKLCRSGFSLITMLCFKIFTWIFVYKLFRYTVLPRLVRMHTIKLTRFLMKKLLYFLAISWDSWHLWAGKT